MGCAPGKDGSIETLSDCDGSHGLACTDDSLSVLGTARFAHIEVTQGGLILHYSVDLHSVTHDELEVLHRLYAIQRHSSLQRFAFGS